MPFTERTPRVAAARKLTSRAGRARSGRFLAEGRQAVTEALNWAAAGAGRVHELFLTDPDDNLAERARLLGVPVSMVTERAAAGLSETVTPQGIVAVCDLVDVPLAAALSNSPELVAVGVGTADPGNAGTLLRVADAAGAGAVVFAGDAVDPHNGKCVRASTGSLFHPAVARVADPAAVVAACREAGLRVLAADGRAETDIDTLGAAVLAAPSAWLFGNEAHGLPHDVITAADMAVRVPIYGAAESLNLATAAAVCLYASARARSSAARAGNEYCL